MLREQISRVALEWGWGIALLALALPPGCVRYPIVVLQGPVCVSRASSACREALLCFPLWFYSGGGFLFIEGRMSSPGQRLLL